MRAYIVLAVALTATWLLLSFHFTPLFYRLGALSIVLVVAAAEVVVGLAIIVAIFRRRESASVDELSELSG